MSQLASGDEQYSRLLQQMFGVMSRSTETAVGISSVVMHCQSFLACWFTQLACRVFVVVLGLYLNVNGLM